MSYGQYLQRSRERSKMRRGGINEMLGALIAQTQPQASPQSGTATAPVQAAAARRVAQGGGTGVDSWINQALGILGLDPSYAPGIKNMIMKESSGNPKAINNWDSNAKRGTPSKGLMQTIDPTFQQWALPGYNKDVYDPVSNIIAGVRYALNRYGPDMIKAGGRKNAQGKYIGY